MSEQGGAGEPLLEKQPIESAFRVTDMPGLSVDVLNDMRELLKGSHQPRAGYLLAAEAGRQLVRDLVPMVFGAAGIHLDPLERVEPLLKPLAETVLDSVKDSVTARVDDAASRMRTRILQSGRSFDWDKRSDLVREHVSSTVSLTVKDSTVNAATKAAAEMAENSTRLAEAERDAVQQREEIRSRERAQEEKASQIEVERHAELLRMRELYRPRPPYRPPPPRR